MYRDVMGKFLNSCFLILVALFFLVGCKTFPESKKQVRGKKNISQEYPVNAYESESDISYYKQRSPGVNRITQPGVLKPKFTSQAVDGRLLREKEANLNSGSLWSEESSQNFMFGSNKALNIGDIIYINLKEDIRAMLERNKKKPGSFFSPVARSQGRKRGRVSKASTNGPTTPQKTPVKPSTEGKVTNKPPKKPKNIVKNTYITARIIDKLSNDTFLIEGHKLIDVNRTIRQILVSGYVNRKDINSKDEVDSRKMADLSIDYAVVAKK